MRDNSSSCASSGTFSEPPLSPERWIDGRAVRGTLRRQVLDVELVDAAKNSSARPRQLEGLGPAVRRREIVQGQDDGRRAVRPGVRGAALRRHRPPADTSLATIAYLHVHRGLALEAACALVKERRSCVPYLRALRARYR